MKAIRTICRKELSDNFSSTRFILLMTLILMVSLISSYMVGMGIKEELKDVVKTSYVFLMIFTSTGKYFSLIQFMGFFGPLIGILLGFDAVNRERSNRTLSKLASQPIYRDSIINGKFLAGVITITLLLLAIILIMSGIGLRVLGIVPGPEDIGRIALYLVITICYISLWLGVSIFFSILFRSMATSALAAISCWILLSFFVSFGAGLAADAIVPVKPEMMQDNPEMVLKHENIRQLFTFVSPMVLYSESTNTIMNPLRRTTQALLYLGPMERASISRFRSALPLSQSVLLVAPHIISLIAITLIFFALSYGFFMRQEIRST